MVLIPFEEKIAKLKEKIKKEEDRAAKQYAKDHADELAEIEEVHKKSSTPMLCPYCELGITKCDRRTGQVIPCRDCKKRKVILDKYDLSLHDFYNILKQQHNECAICCRKFGIDRPYFIHIDHCHELHHVRGLLCGKCNMALGQFGDNEFTVKNAVKYLVYNKVKRSWWAQKIFNAKNDII